MSKIDNHRGLEHGRGVDRIQRCSADGAPVHAAPALRMEDLPVNSGYEIGPYDPCPCGSGKKYKFCCAARWKDVRHGKYPIGTVAFYGPDDKTTTKIAAGVMESEFGEIFLERWVGTDILNNAKVREEIRRFFVEHAVRSVVVSDGNMGCPHEEGDDFPRGSDCPFCPFWAGKQGSARRDEPVFGPAPTDADLELDKEDEDLDQLDDEEEADFDEEDENYRGCFERMRAIIGDPEDIGVARERIAKHFQAQLQLPLEVTGIEDFQWEERYVIGGWDPREYKKLRKTQPSYTDCFRLIAIEYGPTSRWMMFAGEDIAAHVIRVSDGKKFILGLAELEATDRGSPDYQLLRDYAVWFANSR